jgi:hypothetical protein
MNNGTLADLDLFSIQIIFNEIEYSYLGDLGGDLIYVHMYNNTLPRVPHVIFHALHIPSMQGQLGVD